MCPLAQQTEAEILEALDMSVRSEMFITLGLSSSIMSTFNPIQIYRLTVGAYPNVPDGGCLKVFAKSP